MGLFDDAVSSVTDVVKQTTSDVGSFESDLFKKQIDLKNLSYAVPGLTQFTSSGREAIATNFQPLAQPLMGLFGGVPGVSAGLSAANNAGLFDKFNVGSFFSTPGSTTKAPTGNSSGGYGAGAPTYGDGAPGLPAWVLPAGIVGAVLVLALVLRK